MVQTGGFALTSSFQCPLCRLPLKPITKPGSKTNPLQEVETEERWECPNCAAQALHNRTFHRWDFSNFLFKSTNPDRERVDWAYRLYSLAYAPLALLNMLAVWRAGLGLLVGHYASAFRQAQGPILDVAIGDGALTALALHRSRAAISLIGLDLSPEMLAQAETRLRTRAGFYSILADACAIPLASDSYETICCFGGLHVIAHPAKAIHEMVRVLRPGGHFFASILLQPRGKVSQHLAKRYVELGFLSTSFSKTQALSLLTEAGLTIERSILNGRMLLVTARKLPVSRER